MKTLLLSVEPTQPEFVARSHGSLAPSNISDIFLTSDPSPKINQVDLFDWANFNSDLIQWNAWSIVKDWKESIVESDPINEGVDELTNWKKQYVDAIIKEAAIINCAGYPLIVVNCIMDIRQPSFSAAAQIGVERS